MLIVMPGSVLAMIAIYVLAFGRGACAPVVAYDAGFYSFVIGTSLLCLVCWGIVFTRMYARDLQKDAGSTSVINN